MRLRYVVVDELHVLRGVFGTHVGHLLRRLRRICEAYGASPTFVFSSATIGQPGRLAADLCGQPVEEVTERRVTEGRAAGGAGRPDGHRRAEGGAICQPGHRRPGGRAGALRAPHPGVLPQPGRHRGGGR
jgi:ATP-dependent helicase YprA (DUF1998 family)